MNTRGASSTAEGAGADVAQVVLMLAADGPGGPVFARGRAEAGPVCPVESIPPDPGCAPRPVAGAVIVVTDIGGREVLRVTTDDAGEFAFSLSPGVYVLAPQAVAGLLGVPQPTGFTVPLSEPLLARYDTGIR
jgi:hypothetical protein